jgi:hypothetical protein
VAPLQVFRWLLPPEKAEAAGALAKDLSKTVASMIDSIKGVVFFVDPCFDEAARGAEGSGGQRLADGAGHSQLNRDFEGRQALPPLGRRQPRGEAWQARWRRGPWQQAERRIRRRRGAHRRSIMQRHVAECW